MSQAKEKVEEYERRLREEGMSSSGVGSIHSDQDSGKHSDNSLVISRYCVLVHILKCASLFASANADQSEGEWMQVVPAAVCINTIFSPNSLQTTPTGTVYRVDTCCF